MTEISTKAFEMQLELKALLKQRGIRLKPQFIPLAAPVGHAVCVEGRASTSDIDLARQRFKPWAFTNLCLFLSGYPKPPLLFKHDSTQVAGIIESLQFDDHGNLRIVAEVTHPLAKRCNAFGIGAPRAQLRNC